MAGRSSAPGSGRARAAGRLSRGPSGGVGGGGGRRRSPEPRGGGWQLSSSTPPPRLRRLPLLAGTVAPGRRGKEKRGWSEADFHPVRMQQQQHEPSSPCSTQPRRDKQLKRNDKPAVLRSAMAAALQLMGRQDGEETMRCAPRSCAAVFLQSHLHLRRRHASGHRFLLPQLLARRRAGASRPLLLLLQLLLLLVHHAAGGVIITGRRERRRRRPAVELARKHLRDARLPRAALAPLGRGGGGVHSGAAGVGCWAWVVPTKRRWLLPAKGLFLRLGCCCACGRLLRRQRRSGLGAASVRGCWKRGGVSCCDCEQCAAAATPGPTPAAVARRGPGNSAWAPAWTPPQDAWAGGEDVVGRPFPGDVGTAWDDDGHLICSPKPPPHPPGQRPRGHDDDGKWQHSAGDGEDCQQDARGRHRQNGL